VLGLRDWAKRRVDRAIVRHARSMLQQVRARPEQGLFNFRCHENCVEWLRTHPGTGLTVVEALMVDGGVPILHYLVRDGAGIHLEVTLGWRAEAPGVEYYHVRDLLPEDHRHVLSEFERSLAAWADAHLPWWARLLGVDRVC
jgi:hypothetical protein